jgi:hypothetical protein
MRRSDDGQTGPDESEGHGMDWLIAGVLFILIVAMLVRLKKSERR